MAYVLIVEDAVAIAELLSDHLRRAGHEAEVVHRGEDALQAFERHRPDLVVLDLMLPGVSGLEVCQRIRAAPPPQPIVLMLTARVSEEDSILGFEVGADDYVRKPFRIRELMARIEALLRLARRTSRPAEQPSTIACGELHIDIEARTVTVGQRPVRLTPLELDLLCHLALHPGVVLSRKALLQQVWGYQHEGYMRTVDSHVTRVRSKLRQAGLARELVHTVHGRGYRFEEQEG